MSTLADLPPLALVSYSTKPRGGVVHTLALGEALHRAGVDVLVGDHPATALDARRLWLREGSRVPA